jgi:hypothetical protein
VAHVIKVGVAIALWAGLAIAQPAAGQDHAIAATTTAQPVELVADASAILTTAGASVGAARTSAARATGLDQSGEKDDGEPGSWVILLAGAFLIGSVAQRRASGIR